MNRMLVQKVHNRQLSFSTLCQPDHPPFRTETVKLHEGSLTALLNVLNSLDTLPRHHYPCPPHLRLQPGKSPRLAAGSKAIAI